MRNIFIFILTSLLSVVMMVFLMAFVFNKPLTIGWSKLAYDKKIEYFNASDNHNSIVIVAGSNGIFSHSCATIETNLHRKCINFAVSAGLGLDYILEKSKEVLTPNVDVILPLEYNFYSSSESEELKSIGSNVNLIENDQKYLSKFGSEKLLYAIFSKDLRYVASSILENLLVKVGFKMRFTVSNLNIEGDMMNHTKENGKDYASFVASLEPARPMLEACEDNYDKQIIANYIKYVHSLGGQVYGSFPTTFNDKLSQDDIKAMQCIKSFYKKNGASFLELPSNSMYSRESFYDTFYHLNESAQIEHSKILSGVLKRELSINQ
ncbi:MAG: hypothetical protein PHC75_01260 [Burkholderiales bacterium]|nr:hypothetical protein [Burkholderiales bacterium]